MSQILESNSFKKKKKKSVGHGEEGLKISIVIFIIFKYHNRNKISHL